MHISPADRGPLHILPPSVEEALYLALQFLIVCSIELADDLFRGNVSPPSASLGQAHAREIATFEWSHGFFLEPAVQSFATSHTGGALVVMGADFLYAVGHLAVFAAVLLWVYVRHRQHFSFIRTVAVVTSALTTVVSELFPTAPPRLVTGLALGGGAIHIRDTMSVVIGDGTLHGTGVGYNQYSTMPSLHMAWAIIAGACLIVLAPTTFLRLLGILYPVLMLSAVVITGGHFLLDAAGALAVTAATTALAALLHGRVQPARLQLSSRTTRVPTPIEDVA